MTAVFLLHMALPLHGFEITDALGRSQTFESSPQSIVVAGRGLLMVADALYLFPEASTRVIGIERITIGKADFLSVIDPLYTDKIQLPIDVGAEQIASMHPDVVLMKGYMRKKLGRSLETLGIPVVYLDFETPEQYERDLGILGTLLNNVSRSEELIAYYGTRMGRIEKRLHGMTEPEKPRALFIYYSERGGSRAFNVPPKQWMQTQLVERAGGRPVWKDMKTGRGWTRVSFEQIASWDADFIFVTSYFTDVDGVKARLLADELWSSLRAVREGRLFSIPADYYSWDLPDPRWILGLVWLAATLHPERFGDMDIMAETRNFFRELYFLDEAGYNRYILSVLGGDLP
jgi:iron complex transport system substrate-binding protein